MEIFSSAKYELTFHIHEYDSILGVNIVLHNSLMSCKGEWVTCICMPSTMG